METTTKKQRALIEPNIAHRLGLVEKLGDDSVRVKVSAARAAYEDWGTLRNDRTGSAPVMDSAMLDGKKYALEQLGVQIKTARMTGDTAEARELKERRKALAEEIDAAESDREAATEDVRDRVGRLVKLRARAEKLELEALEACREKLARDIEAAVLAEPLCLRFPAETPDEALRLVRVADDLVEREFPLYVPRVNLFDMLAPEVATALLKARE